MSASLTLQSRFRACIVLQRIAITMHTAPAVAIATNTSYHEDEKDYNHYLYAGDYYDDGFYQQEANAASVLRPLAPMGCCEKYGVENLSEPKHVLRQGEHKTVCH